jgi:hypothetical protein
MVVVNRQTLAGGALAAANGTKGFLNKNHVRVVFGRNAMATF